MNRITAAPGFVRPAFVPDAERAFAKLLAAHSDIELIDAVLVDINGIMRGKRFSVSEAKGFFESGMQIPHSVFLMDPLGEMTNPFGRGIGDGDPDGTAWPIPASVRRAFGGAVGRAQMLMTLRDDKGEIDPADSRGALERVIEAFEDVGLTPVTAVELEFYLIDPKRDPAGSPQPARDDLTGHRENSHAVYETAALDRHASFLSLLAAAAEAEGLPLTCVNSEYGPAQFEANLRHQANALEAADHALFLKRVVREVARASGYRATFMAKPWPARAGNGLTCTWSPLPEIGRASCRERV